MARSVNQYLKTLATQPPEVAQAALEEFIRRGEERQRGRSYAGRARGGMTRSNLKYARRPEGWREWVQALIKRRLPRHKSVVIPVRLRPGVPRVDAALGYPEQREAILAEARKTLPAHQFKGVYGRWLQGAEVAERRAAWEADRRDFLADMRAAYRGRAA